VLSGSETHATMRAACRLPANALRYPARVAKLVYARDLKSLSGDLGINHLAVTMRLSYCSMYRTSYISQD
jgi:hypothetical protein